MAPILGEGRNRLSEFAHALLLVRQAPTRGNRIGCCIALLNIASQHMWSGDEFARPLLRLIVRRLEVIQRALTELEGTPTATNRDWLPPRSGDFQEQRGAAARTLPTPPSCDLKKSFL